MAVGFKIPKGVKVSKESVSLISSAAYLSRVKARREAIKESKVETGFYPEGDLMFRVLSADIRPARKYRGKGEIFADDYMVRMQIADPTHKHDGKEFTKRYRVQDPRMWKTKPTADKKAFLGDAAELKQLLEAALPEDQRAIVQANEEKWLEIILQVIAADLVFEGRAWTRESTGDNGERYFDRHLRVFGQLSDADGSGTETETAEETEETAETTVSSAEEEAEAEEVEETEETEETEEGGGALEVGMTVKVNHPKRGELEVVVKEIDEDNDTFVGTFEDGGKKLRATFKPDDILAVV